MVEENDKVQSENEIPQIRTEEFFRGIDLEKSRGRRERPRTPSGEQKMWEPPKEQTTPANREKSASE